MRKTGLLLAVGLATVFSASAGQLSGQTVNGSYYSVEVPAGWAPADGLVIWNHGFDSSPPAPVSDLGPLAALQLSEGYAVAASSYSLSDWSLFNSARDLELLLAEFSSAFGAPDQIILYGASLGGLVSVQAAESGALGNVAGAMSLCGPLAGSRFWDGIVDFRLAYDAVCQGIPGAEIPGGAGGLTNPPDPGFDSNALLAALNACTGNMLTPGARTAQQQQNLDLITSLTTVPESWLATRLALATFGLNDLVFSKLGGGQAMDNASVVYADALIDQQIERVSADTEIRNRLFRNYTPTGALSGARMIALHTDQDGFVFPEHVGEYAAVAPPDRFSAAIVVEATPSHCGFSEAETVAGWEALRGWIAGLPQPTAQDLQDTCNALVAGSLAVGPCRIDPAYVLGDLDSRIPERAGFVPLPMVVPSLGPLALILLIAAVGWIGIRSLRPRRG